MTFAEKHRPKFDRYLSDGLEAEIKRKTAVALRLTRRTTRCKICPNVASPNWNEQVPQLLGQCLEKAPALRVMHRKFPGNVARWPQPGPSNCGNFCHSSAGVEPRLQIGAHANAALRFGAGARRHGARLRRDGARWTRFIRSAPRDGSGRIWPLCPSTGRRIGA